MKTTLGHERERNELLLASEADVEMNLKKTIYWTRVNILDLKTIYKIFQNSRWSCSALNSARPLRPLRLCGDNSQTDIFTAEPQRTQRLRRE